MPTFNGFPVFYKTVKNVTKRQMFGLNFLKSKEQIYFNELIEYYDSSVNISIEIPPQANIDLRRKLHNAADLMEASDDLSKVKQVSHLAAQKAAAIESFDWYQSWNRDLLKAENWAKLKQALNKSYKAISSGNDSDYQKNQLALIKQRDWQFDVLQRNWRRHAKFSHFTTNALIHAAKRLAMIEEFIQESKIEFNQRSHKLPDLQRIQYAQYLLATSKKIKEEKQELSNAMSARLRLIVETRNMANDDVTVDLIEKLKGLDVLKQSTPLEQKRLPAPFSSENFIFIYQYVAQQGDSATLRRLFNLQQTNKTTLLIAKTCATHTVFLPAILNKYIPSKPAPILAFFKGHQLRYEFFKDKLPLLLQLVFLADMKITANCYLDIAQDTTWQQLKDTEIMIDKALLEAEKKTITGWKARFYKETNQFLADWQILLKEQQRKVLQHQLTFLEAWAETPPLNHALNLPQFEPDQRNKMLVSLTELKDGISAHFTENENEHTRFHNLKHDIKELFIADIHFAELPIKAESAVNQLAARTTLETQHLAQAVDFCKRLSGMALQEFKEKHQTQFNSMLNYLIDFFKAALSESIDISEISSSSALVRQCVHLLRHIKSPTIEEKLAKVIENAIKTFQETIDSLVPPLGAMQHDKLKAYHDLLELLASKEQIPLLVRASLKLRRISVDKPVMKEQELLPVDRILPAFSVTHGNDEQPDTFLAKQRQALQQRQAEHAQIMQVFYGAEQALEAAISTTEKAVHSCEQMQQTCTSLLFQNKALLTTLTAKSNDQHPENAIIAGADFNYIVPSDSISATSLERAAEGIYSPQYRF